MEVPLMDTAIRTREGTNRAGSFALALGILMVVSTVFTFVLSIDALNDAVLGDIDPPNWLRALALAGLPLGFFGTPIAYAFARNGPGRDRARLGIGLMIVGLAAFVALQFAMG
jgi:hypothetical protein